MSSSKHSTSILNTSISQSAPVETTPQGSTSRVTSDGSIVRSDDPSTHPDASLGSKLKGDIAGAASGTLGSLQAAAGATLRNEAMQNKGLEKMQSEDERLGAKRGVMPVGTGQRETKTEAETGPAAEGSSL